MASDVVEYIYDFGVPKSYFHCRYAIYYVDPINRIYEYFTLEKTKNDKIDTYIICGKKNKRHKNYSKECEDNFDTFESMGQDIIETQFKNYKESDL